MLFSSLKLSFSLIALQMFLNSPVSTVRGGRRRPSRVFRLLFLHSCRGEKQLLSDSQMSGSAIQLSLPAQAALPRSPSSVTPVACNGGGRGGGKKRKGGRKRDSNSRPPLSGVLRLTNGLHKDGPSREDEGEFSRAVFIPQRSASASSRGGLFFRRPRMKD